MHWDCPHCGVTLTISEERAGAGWSFSRCSRCNGFALIRRAETHVIKVDRAPSGEKVLIPDAAASAHTNPAQNHLMSASAQRRLNEITRPIARQVAPPAPPIEARYTDLRVPSSEPLPIGLPPSIALPQPLPYLAEAPSAPKTPRLKNSFDLIKALPFAMGVFGTIAIGSGFYLFQQGQAFRGRLNADRTERNERRREAQPASLPATAQLTDQVRQTAVQ
jgi:Zn-finger nucleic acid-binding protein